MRRSRILFDHASANAGRAQRGDEAFAPRGSAAAASAFAGRGEGSVPTGADAAVAAWVLAVADGGVLPAAGGRSAERAPRGARRHAQRPPSRAAARPGHGLPALVPRGVRGLRRATVDLGTGR